LEIIDKILLKILTFRGLFSIISIGTLIIPTLFDLDPVNQSVRRRKNYE